MQSTMLKGGLFKRGLTQILTVIPVQKHNPLIGFKSILLHMILASTANFQVSKFNKKQLNPY